MAKIGNQGDGGGRPPVVFDAAQTAQVEALAAVLSKGQMADYFNISEPTLKQVEQRQPEVSLAYKRGRAKAIQGVGSNLIAQAANGNVSAMVFYLKTQAGWREDKEQTDTRPVVNINYVSPSDNDSAD
jgi:hypothetical protein